jgi:hypothetical protein
VTAAAGSGIPAAASRLKAAQFNEGNIHVARSW